jgi:glycosyltransferase involved in cell wall biosynthesis
MQMHPNSPDDRCSLTVVSVAYPFAPLSDDPVGGAEQILARLDKALTNAGHRSIVVAQDGSSVAGDLRPVGGFAGAITDTIRASVYRDVRNRIAEILERDSPDVIHFHGVDFADYLAAAGDARCLVTLHLPLDWYPPGALRLDRPRTMLIPVSTSQAKRAPTAVTLSSPVENGVPMPDSGGAKGDFALTLGRVCREKGIDDALDAAHESDSRLLVAGSVFPYPEHRRYWRRRIRPRLDHARRWIGRIAGMRKQRLLARAKCLLVPSRAAETSSLVAMEALAAGTPVIAYPSGALPDIVEHGRTGFIVKDAREMASAIRAVNDIDPKLCRERARERFPVDRMIAEYFHRYRSLAA